MTERDTHLEPFVVLADVAHDRALIAWGGFWFRREENRGTTWRLADDEELAELTGRPGARCIGADSQPFGHAVVEAERDGRVVARSETSEHNHVWLLGLEPSTEYRYRVIVDGRPWADGERCEWDADTGTLARRGRGYDNRFRTFPRPDTSAPVRFAVLGDFGVGILRRGEDSDRQAELARALERSVDGNDVAFVLTVGDNVYLGTDATSHGTGDEDDDWYGSFYQPYRYLLNRMPFFPAVGNHDASDTEQADDRDQLLDNYFVEERFRPQVDAGRASLDPGLFYRFGVGSLVEFICIDTSLATELAQEHYFDEPAHFDWLRETLEGPDGERRRWRIPFCHHPPYCAGPEHGNTTGMVERLVPLFRDAGVRLVLSGHEHNFQHAVVDGIHYVVSGAAGKLRHEPARDFEAAGTLAWAAAGHFLLVDADDDRIVVQPVAGVAEDGTLRLVEVRDPGGGRVEPTIVVR